MKTLIQKLRAALLVVLSPSPPASAKLIRLKPLSTLRKLWANGIAGCVCVEACALLSIPVKNLLNNRQSQPVKIMNSHTHSLPSDELVHSSGYSKLTAFVFLFLLMPLIARAQFTTDWRVDVDVRSGFADEYSAVVEVDGGDVVAVSVIRLDNAQNDILVVQRRRKADGVLVWSQDFVGSGGLPVEGGFTFITKGADGALFVAAKTRSGGGGYWIVKLDGSTGAVIWQREVANTELWAGIQVGADGDVYGAGFGGSVSSLRVVKVSGVDGSVVWTYDKAHAGNGSALFRAMALDPAGHVVAAGDRLGGCFAARIDSQTGIPIWEMVDTQPYQDCVAVDATRLYISGRASSPITGNQAGYAMARSLADGSLIWRHFHEASRAGRPAESTFISLVGGAVYVSGNEDTDDDVFFQVDRGYVLRLDAASGVQSWVTAHPSIPLNVYSHIHPLFASADVVTVFGKTEIGDGAESVALVRASDGFLLGSQVLGAPAGEFFNRWIAAASGGGFIGAGATSWGGSGGHSLLSRFSPNFQPLAITLPAVDVTVGGATLKGSANTALTVGSAWFEYGQTSAYGLTTPPVALSEGYSLRAMSAAVSGLTDLVEHHCRLVVQNSVGIAYGADAVFLPGNNAPTPVNDAAFCDGAVVLIDVLANDSDLDAGQILSIVSVTSSAQATITLQGGMVRYEPGPNYIGRDSFSYTVVDSYGATATATVRVQVANPFPSHLQSRGSVVPGAGVVGSGIPTGAVWSSFGVPTINDAGQAAVLGTFKVGTVSTTAILGWELTDLATMKVVAKKGDAAPGITNAVMSAFKDPLLGPDGSVAWIATLANAPTTTGAVLPADNVAIFLDADGTGAGAAVVVARKGALATGATIWKTFTSVALGENAVAFTGVLETKIAGVSPGPGGATTLNDSGLWVYTVGLRHWRWRCVRRPRC